MDAILGSTASASSADHSIWVWLMVSAFIVLMVSYIRDTAQLQVQNIFLGTFRVFFFHIVPVLCGKRDPRDMRGLPSQSWTNRAFEIPRDSLGLSVLSLPLLCLRYLDPICLVVSIPPLVVSRNGNLRPLDIGFYCIVGLWCLFAFLDGLVRAEWVKQRRVRWLASFAYPTVLKDSFVAQLQEKRKGEPSGMGFQITWSAIFSPRSFEKAKATANLAFDDD
ncbi:hypothetical protein N7488_012470 [Penicillium malachiteum]|nr:hypothetical protein N7488_012470 [Penicillium malachiteum]